MERSIDRPLPMMARILEKVIPEYRVWFQAKKRSLATTKMASPQSRHARIFIRLVLILRIDLIFMETEVDRVNP